MLTVISELPHLPNEEDIVYIQQPQSPESERKSNGPDKAYHCCQYSRVMQALQRLKDHNPFIEMSPSA